jgi:putative transcriptional regulator
VRSVIAKREKVSVSVRFHHECAGSCRVPIQSVPEARRYKKLGLSQNQFAQVFGISASALRKWEQGQRYPTGAAETLLKIIDREPQAVIRALKD